MRNAVQHFGIFKLYAGWHDSVTISTSCRDVFLFNIANRQLLKVL